LEFRIMPTLSLIYGPDAAGNRESLVDPQGRPTSYRYNGSNLVERIENGWGEVTSLEYDELGRERGRTLANGVVLARAYDEVGRSKSLEYTQSGGALLARYSLSYDSVSGPQGLQARQVVSEQVRDAQGALQGSTLTCLFDAVGQLVSEVRAGAHPYSLSYGYDEVGNRVRQVKDGVETLYSYDAANQLLQESTGGAATLYAYDEVGNLQSVAQGAQSTSYEWDEENRLTGVLFPDGSREDYLYSADGLRQRKVSTPAGGGVAATTYFMWDGGNLLQELDGSGSLLAHYTDFPGRWGGLASVRRGAASGFYVSDAQENVRLLLDGSARVSGRYSSTAFGEPVQDDGPDPNAAAIANPLRFGGAVGYYADAPARLYVRARHLDTHAGRWSSEDPIGFQGGDVNLYRYVGNRAGSHVDPSGLWDGPSIHGKCTRQWAKEVYVRLEPNKYVYFSSYAANLIGDGAEREDNEMYGKSAAFYNQWPQHFNWHGDQDWNIMFRGGTFDGRPDTRVSLYNDWAAQAGSLMTPRRIWMRKAPVTLLSCNDGLRSLGEGLHGIEDIHSHAGLTPADHQDIANDSFVDNPGYKMVSTNNYYRREFHYDIYQQRYFGVTGGQALNALKMSRMRTINIGFGQTATVPDTRPFKVRVYRWQRDRSFSRMNATEYDVKRRLEKFLRENANSSCLVRSCRKPPTRTAGKCGRVVDPVNAELLRNLHMAAQ